MKNKCGFTLIEVLIAISLLGIISAALVAFLPTIVTLNRTTSNEQDVTVSAKRFLEQVRVDWQDSTNFDNAQLNDSTSVDGYAVPNSTCTSAVSDPDGGAGIRKRVTLTCAGSLSPFIVEFGNPA